ncbi:hypothetical protein ABK792_21775 [Enterobacter hormaechei]|uniref:hypothetical protein n=1 Tax=Enterobacter hormaechei TaxID=158836 RepID=UPI002931D862|nr:hypothetical protein [Enterobacter hormaechei]
MQKYKRIGVSDYDSDAKSKMEIAGFTWKYFRRVPIADSIEFYCCERDSDEPLPDNLYDFGWGDESVFRGFTELQVAECKAWAAAPQQEVK